MLAPYGKRLVDLTPAALGPFVVPAVNLDEHLDAAERQHGDVRWPGDDPGGGRDRGGSSTVPYAEIVASIASRSAGPGTRANIDEFTETTARAITEVGGAAARQGDHRPQPGRATGDHARHRAALVNDPDAAAPGCDPCSRSTRMVADVAAYVPGYRLKQAVQFTAVGPEDPVHTLVGDDPVTHQVSVFLEVEGAAHYLPAYAGNLDIMTSAALRVAERMAEHAVREVSA